MTNEEAIKKLKEAICYTPYRYGEAFEMAIEALKKQIPKKPSLYTTEFPSCCRVTKCSTCGKEFGFNYGFNYCEDCGQAIDWSE